MLGFRTVHQRTVMAPQHQGVQARAGSSNSRTALLQWEEWAGKIPSCPVCGTNVLWVHLPAGAPEDTMHTGCKCFLFQMQWHQKLTELTELTHRPSLGGGKSPSRQASRVNSCCWRLCHARTRVSSAWQQPGETFTPQQL